MVHNGVQVVPVPGFDPGPGQAVGLSVVHIGRPFRENMMRLYLE
jgi:hypothetical protein